MHSMWSAADRSRISQASLCQRAKRAWVRWALALAIVCMALPAVPAVHVRAAESQRTVRTTKNVLAQHWNLLRWSTGTPVCDFHVEASGLPSLEDVKNNCSDWTYQAWSKTPVCAGAAEGDASNCTGLFLVYLGAEVADVIQVAEFPPPTVTVEATNCKAWAWCAERPKLAFLGIEPMTGQSIKSIHVKLGEQERICTAATCELRMPLTDDQGVQLEYWAVSTYGDEGPHQLLPLRNRTPQSQPEQFRLELLGQPWAETAPTGAVRWGIFPSTTHAMAPILEQLTSPADLATQRTYLYLSGRLIAKGLVNGLGCPDGGLNTNGTANTCGQERAQARADEWQNRYDVLISTAARANDVPARLLKALMARETQLWPDSGSPYELGLGRMTENGADLLLSWNLPFYLNICTSQYQRLICAGGFSNLSETRKSMLRAKALQAVGTDQEINLVAATLSASSAQVEQMIKNVTSKAPGKVVTLEDMWAMTIGNYHTGSGCVGAALALAATHNPTLTWSEVASHLSSGCQAGKTYVDEVLGLAK
jgi:hypothetical protein